MRAETTMEPAETRETFDRGDEGRDAARAGAEPEGPRADEALAREVFARFVLEGEETPREGLAALCREHPRLAARLEELYSAWRRVHGVLGAVRAGSRGRRGRGSTDALAPAPGDGPESRWSRSRDAGGSTTGPPPRRASDPAATPRAGTAGASGSAELMDRLALRRPRDSRYAVEGEIARGGMGAILRVWDEDLGRHLAMKVILGPDRMRPDPREVPSEDAGGTLTERDERVLGRFLEEAQVTGQLDHPGIVPVHELGVDERGRAFFTMRLVRGRDLRRIFELVWKEEEGWNPTRALGVVLKICEAMAYAHEKGVIHRDLKPANVMVGRFGEVYVMDWGLARVLGHEGEPPPAAAAADEGGAPPVRTARADDPDEGTELRTRDGDVIGTPAYMSPEQASGRLSEIGPASDVYAVGAILYHLLGRRMPYVRRGQRPQGFRILRELLSGPPPTLAELEPGVAPELVAICERAMERDPARRYATMMDMARDLRAYLEGRVVSAYDTGSAAQFKKWVARNRGTAAGIAATLLAIVTALAVVAWVQTGARREQSDLNARLAGANDELSATNEELTAAQDRNRALLDYRLAQVLGAEADELFPAVPSRVPAIDRWLATTADLLERAPRYAALLAGGGRAAGLGPAELADMARWMDALRPLVEEVRDRRRLAVSLEKLSLADHAAEWEEARAAVAASPVYAGLRLAPQLGLVPLGANPEGLHEFWHVASGARPRLDPRTGHHVLEKGSGLVLVLLPGATYVMGSPPDEPHRFDSERLAEVRLEPYFLSKYETTQDQWERAVGGNPSRYFSERFVADERITPLNPVESIDWHQAGELARRLALEVPSETHWEFACRGGTTTAFYTGDDPRGLVGFENLSDENPMTIALYFPGETWNDGYVAHAPVGSFLPNPLGFFDMAGNVSEWCTDVFLRDDVLEERIYRGGSWYGPASYARSATRWRQVPRVLNETVGVRLGRRLDP